MTGRAAGKEPSRADLMLYGTVVAIGLPVFGIATLIEKYGLLVALLVVAVVLGLGAAYWQWLRMLRAARLRAKYPDAELAQRLIAREIWEGQSAEELLDALGKPVAVDRHKRGGKQRETWNYLPYKGRYRMRVSLEDGHVSSWHRRGGET